MLYTITQLEVHAIDVASQCSVQKVVNVVYAPPGAEQGTGIELASSHRNVAVVGN